MITFIVGANEDVCLEILTRDKKFVVRVLRL